MTGLNFNDAGSYTVEVSNALGSAQSRPATLVVSAAGTAIRLYAGIAIEGIVGRTCNIQFTTDLAQPTWLILTHITLTQPVELWYDGEPARSPTRFCRVDSPCE